jgi:DNA-directed RNA polymerase specialized sigma24 family protein
MAAADENDGITDLNSRGAKILAHLAEFPGDTVSAREFDAAFYQLIWQYLRERHRFLGARVARYLGKPGSMVATLLEGEVDEAAHDATTTALRRVRQGAGKFDPALGTATDWVKGSAELAYSEVARAIIAARRSETLTFLDPDDLLDVEDPGQSTEEHVLRHIGDEDALADAARLLTDREYASVRLRYTLGYSRAETAEIIFGDPTKVRQTDRIAAQALAKLTVAWEDKRSARREPRNDRVSDQRDE